MDASRYFDHAATTPLDPRVLEAMLPALRDDFGNANSLHAFGRTAAAAVERAREQVMSAVGADDPGQIFFTSGSTEACNWAIANHAEGAISPWEHSAVHEPALAAGYRVLPSRGMSLVLEEASAPPDSLACLMRVNNEVGAVWDPASARPAGERLFVDATQALGKVELLAADTDYLAVSAHKAFGPKGVGALFIASGYAEPFQRGGEQEQGARGGTLNVPGIVGFGSAAALAVAEREADSANAAALREIVLDELASLDEWRINGTEGGAWVPHILSLSFLGLEGETLVVEMDRLGFAISAGAACSSRSTEPSHVLTAMGLSPEWLRGTIRVSFGRANTRESAGALAKALRQVAQDLRKLS